MPAALPVVRAAVPADAEPVAAIFAHYVATSVATFEEVAPTAADWQRRLYDLTARNLPFLVAEADRIVCGYAYASPWRPKPAYRHTVEDTVDISPARTASLNFQTSVPEPISRPRNLPLNIGPVETTMVGKSTLAAPMS